MSRLSAENDPDFKILLADRIHKHFFNDGALTPDRNIARLQRRVDESRLSIISESARWRERTPGTWESFQDNLIRSHFPNLTRSMISRFRNAGMYPALDAPEFSQHGGAISSDFELRIRASDGTIYYTLDGSDPRISANPVEVEPPFVVVEESAPKKVYIPSSATDHFTDQAETKWNEPGYADSDWIAGSGGVGFETGNGFQHLIGIDVVDEMHDQRTSCLRRPRRATKTSGSPECATARAAPGYLRAPSCFRPALPEDE